MYRKCKYCGAKVTSIVCRDCKDKLALVRQIQQMIKNAEKGGAE